MTKLIDRSGNRLLNIKYSKNEEFTGQYTIYNKKIYRRSVEWDSYIAKGVGNIAHGISDMKEVVKYEVIATEVQGSSYQFPVTYYAGGIDGTFYSTYFSVNKQYIHYASNINWDGYHFVVNIYYTKY